MNFEYLRNLNIKPEDELILNCSLMGLMSKNNNRIDYLLDSDLNWKYILDNAKSNRLSSILYHNLHQLSSEKIPDDILEYLKKIFNYNACRNLLLTAELVKIMHLMEKNGVDAVTYKGPVLAFSAYENLAFREFGDIDILIKKSDVYKAKKILVDNEYYLDPPIDVSSASYLKLASEYQFRSRDGSIIEINWSFVGSYFYFPNSPKLLFDNVKTLNIDNFEIRTVSPDDEFLMLCIHCSKHNWQRLSWICDLGEILNKKDINWDSVWEKADKLAVKRIVLINLILLVNLFGFEFSQDIIKYADEGATDVAKKILKRRYNDNKDSWNMIEKFFLSLKKRENLIDGVRDCFGAMTTPVYKDYQTIKLPKSFFRLYSIIRPLLLLKRFFSSLYLNSR